MSAEIFRDMKGAVQSVAARLSNARQMLVGIGGATASGKSRFTRQLRRALAAKGTPVCIFEGDRFIRPHVRRARDAQFPDGIYEVDHLKEAIRALAQQRPFLAPFYEKDGWATGRISVAPGAMALPSVVIEECRPRMAKPNSELCVDAATGDVMERIVAADEIWLFDSELSLMYDDLRALCGLTVGFKASRDVRRRNFLGAVSRGERYPLLTPTEAIAKIEGFWKRDDEMVEATLEGVDVLVVLE